VSLLGHVHPGVRIQLEVVSTVAVAVPMGILVGIPVTAVRVALRVAVRLRVSSVRVGVPVGVIMPLVAVGFRRGLCGCPAWQQGDEGDESDAAKDHKRPERKAPA
jgi:hypothetical protein